MAEFDKLAVVTGASSGIGFELAKHCAEQGYNLVIAADGSDIDDAAETLRQFGGSVEGVQADLSTYEGVDELYAAVAALGRPVDVLMANAGRGLGKAFLDQDFADIQQVIDVNVIGTTYLLHKFVRDMRDRNAGKVLITGSIGGLLPGSFQAVYNATKAYVDSFAYALRNELKDTDVTITLLMPGPTDTNFFEVADMLDTKVATDKKDDPAMVAKAGYDAMMRGDGHEVSGFANKMQALMSNVLPQGALAERHRQMAEPGTGKQ
ncbi:MULTISPECIES: SDR family NAD(P)-dependent oxidoreductase [unclassified Devosia]|uniref:SDR family NAD(P)-dependent oxidoreductase n=1 Tax=unclassified Devosia TaxID=196773 RepID=UPI001557E67F|nr:MULTISPECIES: SDR family NAD(P)-dependent oxidoreductase [unclassified Devosia]